MLLLDSSALPLVHEWAGQTRAGALHWDPPVVLPVLVTASALVCDVVAGTAVRSEDFPGIDSLSARSRLVQAHAHLSSAVVWTVQAAQALGVHAHTPQLLSPSVRRHP